MKMRFFLVCLCFVSVLLAVPAAALEDSSANSSAVSSEPVSIETSKEEDGVTVNVTIQNPDSSASADLAEAASSSSADSAEASQQSTYTVSALDDGSAAALSEDSASTTMSQVISGVLGEYTPKTVTVSQYDISGNLLGTSTEIVPGLAGLDYPWLAGAVVFTVFLYGVLRLLGGLLKL